MTSGDGDRPRPPTALDDEARAALAGLENRDIDDLRAAGEYLVDLAAWKAATSNDWEPDADRERAAEADGTPNAAATAGTSANSRDGEQDSSTAADGASADAADGSELEYPAGVPPRASVTVKEIAGSTYHYYQWRDGDRIESKTVQRGHGSH
ncbi:hypothetical protein [Natronolimnohabitans innermongolicus]|uniref:Uncharacterized protein n=1 Tax=Natronolimnohabitans innermongolicus JCM 12255 TaxID=1227499 RepID=L9WK74_9EURY|nr:hypothetical protein [Natronolimnohabitans innermongolicus]ELY48763.1 hypothetical protein C493_21796 [Natronolimnohabitans innermongolicus JCM 12255]